MLDRAGSFNLGADFVHSPSGLRDQLGGFFCGQQTVLDHLVRPLLAHCVLSINGLVYGRVRNPWVIVLVVSEPPVPDEVDDEVLSESRSI